jgi:hypothetical protein
MNAARSIDRNCQGFIWPALRPERARKPSSRVNSISANLMRALGWADGSCPGGNRLIVARHEVAIQRPRPGGTLKVRSHCQTRVISRRRRVHAALETPVFLLRGMLACNLSRDPFNRPLGRGYFPHDSRHFVPGYDHPVPLGRRHSPRFVRSLSPALKTYAISGASHLD